MAGYNNSSSNNRSFSNSAPRKAESTSSTTPARTTDKIQIAGLYDGKEGSKLAMSGKVKEAVTIPAGYVVKVFVKGGKSKNGKDLPPFELVAQPALARKE